MSDDNQAGKRKVSRASHDQLREALRKLDQKSTSSTPKETVPVAPPASNPPPSLPKAEIPSSPPKNAPEPDFKKPSKNPGDQKSSPPLHPLLEKKSSSSPKAEPEPKPATRSPKPPTTSEPKATPVAPAVQKPTQPAPKKEDAAPTAKKETPMVSEAPKAKPDPTPSAPKPDLKTPKAPEAKSPDKPKATKEEPPAKITSKAEPTKDEKKADSKTAKPVEAEAEAKTEPAKASTSLVNTTPSPKKSDEKPSKVTPAVALDEEDAKILENSKKSSGGGVGLWLLTGLNLAALAGLGWWGHQRLQQLEATATDLASTPMSQPASSAIDSATNEELTEPEEQPLPTPEPKKDEPKTAEINQTDEPTDPSEFSQDVRQELILLKERNRLTSYADAAIADGDRESLDRLIEVLSNPQTAGGTGLRQAALAEFLRAKYFHLSVSLNEGYQLPVTDLFQGGLVGSERDLTTKQLLGLLNNQDQNWRNRSRAAQLLTGRTSPDVVRALVKAVRTDPRLEVVKDSYIALRYSIPETEAPGDLFSFIDFEKWWNQYRNNLPKTPPKGPRQNQQR